MRTIDLLPHFWKIFYMVVLMVAAVGATLFPVLYAFGVRWWETAMGRYMMYKGVVLAMALDLITARIFVPHMPVWISIMLLTLIAIMVWWYTVLFCITWYRGRAQRREDRQERLSQ